MRLRDELYRNPPYGGFFFCVAYDPFVMPPSSCTPTTPLMRVGPRSPEADVAVPRFSIGSSGSVVFNPVVQIADIKQLFDSDLFPAACQD